MINIKAILQKAIIAVPFIYGICVVTPFAANAAQAIDPLGSANWIDLQEEYLGDGSVVAFDPRITLLLPPEIENSHKLLCST